MRDRCSCCTKVYKRKSITDEERQAVFKDFWSMSWEARKVFVRAMVQPHNNDTDRKRKRLNYFMKHDDSRVRVCKTMFLNSLDLKEWSVWSWVFDRVKGCPKRSSHYDRAAQGKQFCSEFLDNLPTLPSHYCLKSSSKKYVE